MSEKPEPQFFCPICGAGFVEDHILDGSAIKRYDEVYCSKHFEEKFPNECIYHPGTLANSMCSRCGRMLCERCVIELGGEKICRTCKPEALSDMKFHQPPRIKLRIRGQTLKIQIRARTTKQFFLFIGLSAIYLLVVWGMFSGNSEPGILANPMTWVWLALFGAISLGGLWINVPRRETIIFSPDKIVDKCYLQSRSKPTAQVAGFVVKPIREGRFKSPILVDIGESDNSDQLCLLASDEPILPGQEVVFPKHRTLREKIRDWWRPNPPKDGTDLILALYAQQSELPWLRHILAEHLERIKALITPLQ